VSERWEAYFEDGYWMVLDCRTDCFLHEGEDTLVCGSMAAAKHLVSALNGGTVVPRGETRDGEPSLDPDVAGHFGRDLWGVV
jgi:hypothetical protein